MRSRIALITIGLLIGLHNGNAVASPAAKGVTHQLAKGETLVEIAKKSKVPLQTIQVVNNIVGPEVTVGTEITIPPSSELPRSVGWFVKKGQTLWLISKACGTTVDMLMRDNRLESGTIFPGQRLFIRVASNSNSN